ncbi:unnamed protein product [Alternaria alternata]
MLTVILAFIGIIAAFGAAMPTSPVFSTTVDIANTNINRDVHPNPDTFWQVRVQTFTEDLCHGAYTFLWLDPDICINFNADVKSLRVVGHDGAVKYSSLNVYTSLGCQTGPTVQPVLSRKCYQKGGYPSIKLRT